MTETYEPACQCGAVTIRLTGAPRVRGHCHCEDCRTLLDVPFHSVTAWNADQLEVTEGEAHLTTFQHPSLTMKKVSCDTCGEVIWNTNGMDWRVVSQRFLERALGGLPEELTAQSHFFYDRRIFDIADDLPKKP
ncbi:GFA family protein [Litorisediminicola beolgyonensis]|uniref:GFA family protein n=1 Tax=Litorisediminicola beolgyonensis TaxID=1173614 RepID=A0ABW3ZJX6_9RHOB